MFLVDDVESYAHSNSMSYVVKTMDLVKAVEYISNPDIIEKWLIANRIYLDDILGIELIYASILRQEDDIVAYWGRFNKKTVIMGIMTVLCYEICEVSSVDDLIMNSAILVIKLKNILSELQNE